MSERSRGTARIVAVQRRLRDIAEWKLAAAERAKAEALEARTALDTFIDGANLTGRFAALAIEETRRLTSRERATEARRLDTLGLAQEAKSRLKLAERVADTIARDERAMEERRALERLIESFVARDGQAPDGG